MIRHITQKTGRHLAVFALVFASCRHHAQEDTGDDETPLDMGQQDMGQQDMGGTNSFAPWYGHWYAITGDVQIGAPEPPIADPSLIEGRGFDGLYLEDGGIARLSSHWCFSSIDIEEELSWAPTEDGLLRLTRGEDRVFGDWLNDEFFARTGETCEDLMLFQRDEEGQEEVIFRNSGSEWLSRGELCLYNCDPDAPVGSVPFDYCAGEPPAACDS